MVWEVLCIVGIDADLMHWAPEIGPLFTYQPREIRSVSCVTYLLAR